MVTRHCEVIAYSSTDNKHAKADARARANILVMTLESLREELAEPMGLAMMHPGGYGAVESLKGGYQSLVPPGADSGDKSWQRIFANLRVVAVESCQKYTADVVKVQHNPPTVGKKDEEEHADDVREKANNASAALLHCLKTGRGLQGNDPKACTLFATFGTLGEPLEHWEVLVPAVEQEPFPVIITKAEASAQTLLEWTPSRKISGSRERVYVEPVKPRTPKPVVPLKHLPRCVKMQTHFFM